jgi:hypothetical protein
VSDARIFGYGLAAVVALVAGLVGAWWLSVTEPWYDADIVQRLAAGPHDAPWRDETLRVAELFPTGTEIGAARARLAANGFSCAQATLPDARIRLSCTRETHPLFCVHRYLVEFTADRGGQLADRGGSSYAVCL